MRNSRARWTPCVVVAIGVCPLAGAVEIEVVYSSVPGHPTAQVPGVAGEEFQGVFGRLFGSPDGSRWILKARTNNPDPLANDVIVAGSGRAGVVVAKEGDPAPIDGLTYGAMDSDCGINDVGQFVFGTRLVGAGNGADEILLAFDGVDFNVAAREGESAPGLFDPQGAGNELFGDDLNSAHILSGGTVGFHADLIQNINPSYRSALYRGSTVVAQEGLFQYAGFAAFGGSTFTSSADGGRWIVEADLQPGSGWEDAVTLDGSFVLREGDLLGELTVPVTAIKAVDMTGNGDWFARGFLADDRQWTVRNGTLVAVTGRPVTSTGTAELWDYFMDAADGNSGGDYVVLGRTNAALGTNQVIVLNDDEVVVRMGMPVDLGAGWPETILWVFRDDSVLLTDDAGDELVDDRELYFVACLLDVDEQAIMGYALCVVRLGATACPCDCDGSNDGVVGGEDFVAVLAQWGQTGTACDLGEGAPGVGIDEFLSILANWGPCP